MSPPILKAQSPVTVSFGKTLKLKVPSATSGSLVILNVEGESKWSENSGLPSAPIDFRILYSRSDVTGFRLLMWRKVPKGGLQSITLNADQVDAASGWWAECSVIDNVGYTKPGWIDVPGTLGDYARLTTTEVPSLTSTITVTAWVDFDTKDTLQWFYGWGNSDLGFGLNSDNRPILYVNNTSSGQIGDIAANADIPGFDVNRPMWLRATLDVTTAEIVYEYSFSDLDLRTAAMDHWTTLGTAVTGSNAGTTPRLTNSDTVFIGTYGSAEFSFNGQIYAVYQDRLNDLVIGEVAVDFSEDLPAGLVLLGGDVTHYRPTSEDFPSSPFDDVIYCDGVCYPDNSRISTPALTVPGEDRLLLHVWRGLKVRGPHYNDPITGPADWTTHVDRAANASGNFLKFITRTKEADSNVDDSYVNASSRYLWAYYTIIVRGRADVEVLPVLPQPPRLRLGCADSYRAFFTGPDYETILDEAPWKDLAWSRCLDDISEARGTFPDKLGGVQCLAKRGGVTPWQHGLLIERNDQRVWSGPIRNVSRQGDAISVTAGDILARYTKRFAIRAGIATYDQADCGTIFTEILTTHAALDSDPWTLEVPEFEVGVPIDRVLKIKEFKYAYDVLAELFNVGVDAFVANGVLFVFEPRTGWVYQSTYRRTLPGSYNVNYDLIYGVFTEQAWATRPDWSLDGASAGNYFVVPIAETGEYGYRTFAVAEVATSQATVGVLDVVDPDPLEVPADQPAAQTAAGLRARARALASMRGTPPLAIEGQALSQHAPVDVDNLLPGSIWLLDVYDAGYGELLNASRLHRVDVTVTHDQAGGIVERIVPVLEPLGVEGAPK
jgi:hypothetical protein